MRLLEGRRTVVSLMEKQDRNLESRGRGVYSRPSVAGRSTLAKSDRQGGERAVHYDSVMSALPPKADIAAQRRHCSHRRASISRLMRCTVPVPTPHSRATFRMPVLARK